MAPALLLDVSPAPRLSKASLALTPPDTPSSTSPATTPAPLLAPWQAISAQKIADREANLQRHPEWRLASPLDPNVKHVASYPFSKLTPREREIVSLDATALTELLAIRHYSAVEVATAFCKSAAVAQDLTNCLTEIFFDEALAQAAELDRHLQETGKTVGPLHGLPVSIKDHVLLDGKDTSTGYASWAYKSVATKDAVVVSLLRKAGAVFYVKTANPQTLLSLETENNIYGRTTNPFNRTLTPGGSSGGESALIACHGSPLGVGTDIGGSIRIPAAHGGLYGLKGSVARLPHAGLLGSHDGMEAIVGCVGPLATSARDLGLFCRVMLQYEPWYIEPPLLNMPWNDDLANGKGLPSKLCFALLSDDQVVLPHPPIRAALERTKQALLAAGHEVVEWKPMDHQQAWDLIAKLYLLDGGREYYETMAESGEPPVTMSKWILDHANGREPYTVAETFRLNADREAFRARCMAHWNATAGVTSTGRPVDAILCPVAPTLAPPHGTTRWWGYTSYWNLVDYPSVVFPTGHLSSEDFSTSRAAELPIAPARNDIERYIRDQWSPQTYNGAPIALQLVGRRHEEEKLLGVLGRLEDAIRTHS
ncbi:amidase [Sistotremastrum niveocremeum HHB9708]|uniref:amidase n=1 Tax=Sistotremastrum niveocremeum HHB9708 TaxID=1314777 RepID=A0A164UJX6_9AGAM|nr:amidase [Sistotremastrum niveocremeum HHB9708]